VITGRLAADSGIKSRRPLREVFQHKGVTRLYTPGSARCVLKPAAKVLNIAGVPGSSPQSRRIGVGSCDMVTGGRRIHRIHFGGPAPRRRPHKWSNWKKLKAGRWYSPPRGAGCIRRQTGLATGRSPSLTGDRSFRRPELRRSSRANQPRTPFSICAPGDLRAFRVRSPIRDVPASKTTRARNDSNVLEASPGGGGSSKVWGLCPASGGSRYGSAEPLAGGRTAQVHSPSHRMRAAGKSPAEVYVTRPTAGMYGIAGRFGLGGLAQSRDAPKSAWGGRRDRGFRQAG